MARDRVRERLEGLRRRHAGRRGPRPRDRGRRVHGPRRPVGLRQDDRAADARRPRGDQRGRDPDRRPHRQRPDAARARHRDGLPELRALPAHDRSRTTSRSASSCTSCRRRRSTSGCSDAARILEIEEFLKRKPRALSGGQRQRVAMGRAIVREPQAFLMDEPLSNLDAKLRVQMRAEIQRAPAPPRRDDDLRHARPGRGDDDGRPRRRDAQGRLQQVGSAAGALRPAGQRVRRRLHRLARRSTCVEAKLQRDNGTMKLVVGLAASIRLAVDEHAARSRRRCAATSAGRSCSASGPRTSRTPARRAETRTAADGSRGRST